MLDNGGHIRSDRFFLFQEKFGRKGKGIAYSRNCTHAVGEGGRQLKEVDSDQYEWG